MAELEAVWRDPGGAVRAARDAARDSVSSRCGSFPTSPVRRAAKRRALTDDELDQLAMPPFDGLGHDAAWFARAPVVPGARRSVAATSATEF